MKVELPPESAPCLVLATHELITIKRVDGCYSVDCQGMVKNVGKVAREDIWRELRLIPQRQDISKRPAIVARRSRIGDWEREAVHGKKGLPDDTCCSNEQVHTGSTKF